MAEIAFTFDYVRFWDMCGDKRSTPDGLQRAFNGLFFVASRTNATPHENERIKTLLVTAGANFERRALYFMLKDTRAK